MLSMATVFESIPLNGLRKTHLDQLLWNLNQQENTGTYYGNYEQFMKLERTIRIQQLSKQYQPSHVISYSQSWLSDKPVLT